eukprot:s1386_g3.t1
MEAAEVASAQPSDACHEAAAKLAVKAKAVAGFACAGRGCGRRRDEVPKVKKQETPRGTGDSWEPDSPAELEARARRTARGLESEGAAATVPALRFLSQNIAVPRDLSRTGAAALRAALRLQLAALEQRPPARGHVLGSTVAAAQAFDEYDWTWLPLAWYPVSERGCLEYWRGCSGSRPPTLKSGKRKGGERGVLVQVWHAAGTTCFHGGRLNHKRFLKWQRAELMALSFKAALHWGVWVCLNWPAHVSTMIPHPAGRLPRCRSSRL